MSCWLCPNLHSIDGDDHVNDRLFHVDWRARKPYSSFNVSNFALNLLWVVFDRQVLATNHTVSLEPFTTELLGSSIWSVGPFDSDTVVVGVLLSKGESVARDGEKNSLLWVEDSTWWVDSESLHVGGLDTVSNTTSRRVDHLDVVGVLVIVWGVEDDLGSWLGLDVSWWDGLSHGVGLSVDTRCSIKDITHEQNINSEMPRRNIKRGWSRCFSRISGNCYGKKEQR
ncbi:hypothetical protein GCK72_012885 [Caenorhabditis remanei]|uniref:Uncharacterized protein n=1 Tax=Caenorhabditis remanei TaxID=31234 RepID=A0A6A5GPX6_CAERE|nr:hypothetical protein GCK72_012885 [Caenorhabditis remanei]KAF1756432.1 hypothetical protein GCK72_012885 [Caenorhabditis remanei]